MEYCSHLWDGSAKYQLEALESIERRAKRLIGKDTLVRKRLQSLEHRRKIASLSVVYRIHFGECADDLHDHLVLFSIGMLVARKSDIVS